MTVEVYTLSLKERTKLKGLLEVVSSSAEFETIPIRRHEDALLRRIYDRVPVKLDRADFETPHFKTFLLLQAHFSRLQLPPDLAADQVLVLEKVLNLLSACVDVMSSNAWLNALGAMDLSQMCVQGVWETDSPLKQIPHFEPDVRIYGKGKYTAGSPIILKVTLARDVEDAAAAMTTIKQLLHLSLLTESWPTGGS